MYTYECRVCRKSRNLKEGYNHRYLTWTGEVINCCPPCRKDMDITAQVMGMSKKRPYFDSLHRKV